MSQQYFTLDYLPDLTLSKYASLVDGNIDGVLIAHQNFWRQLNRKGLMNGESFHLFYEYSPQRPQGQRLCIGMRIDSSSQAYTFTEETFNASVLSPYFSLKPVDAQTLKEQYGMDVFRRYTYGSHLVKQERFLPAMEYGQPPYYVVSEWKPNPAARLYTMAKLMAEINLPCMYVVNIYPRDMSADLAKVLDRTLMEIRGTVKPQFGKTGGGMGLQKKDENAKSALDYYEDLLESLSENPHFLVDACVLSDDLQHTRAILDAVASEALQEGAHNHYPFEENISLGEIGENRMVSCADPTAPASLQMLPQLYVLKELAGVALLPVLYPGEWIELPKETVPANVSSGISLGLDNTGHEILFPLKNLSKHAFLAGVPGSGKTNSMMHLINAIHGVHKIPILVFEPAKHEYRAITCVEGLRDVELYSPSAQTRFPLHINPFEFPTGMTLAEHIRNLIAVFDGAFSMDPPMPFLLDASVEEVYADHGWTPAMINTPGNGLKFPTMSELYAKLAAKLEQTDYGPEVKGNLKSALQVRIGSLITREMADVFDVSTSSVPPSEWIKRSAIIELESLGKDPANFLTLLVATLIRETLKTENYIKPPDGRPRHVIFFEEAHNLIGPTAQKTAGNAADPRQAATAYIVKMLAEVRALGEGIVIADQLPTAMAPEVIKNTSLKIGLRITAKDDRELLGSTMNANPDQLEKFSIFIPGHALISYEPLLKPFEVQLPFFEAKEGSLSDKAIITSMMGTSRYVQSIRRSVEIMSAMWETQGARIKKDFDNHVRTRRTIVDALEKAQDDLPTSKENRKKLAEANLGLHEGVKKIARLKARVLAYETPIHFLLSGDIPAEWEAYAQDIEAIKQSFKTIQRKIDIAINDIFSVMNAVRTEKKRPPYDNRMNERSYRLLVASRITWNEMD